MRQDALLSGILACLQRLCAAQGVEPGPRVVPLSLAWLGDIAELDRREAEAEEEHLRNLELERMLGEFA